MNFKDEVMKSLEHLEDSTKKLREYLEKPDSRPHEIDEAIEQLESDSGWLKGQIKRWLRVRTRRGY